MNLKILITVTITALLLGCAQTTPTSISDYQSSLESDPMFKDCIAKKVRDVTEGSSILSQSITVVRCPNSTTTTYYKSGEDPSKTTIVIDGITYERKDK